MALRGINGINEVFLYKKMYDRFAGPKNGRSNKVTVLPRWP